jgi:hypothetical protein
MRRENPNRFQRSSEILNILNIYIYIYIYLSLYFIIS